MNETDDGLLVAAISGDRDALSSLLAQHGPAVRNAIKISPKWQDVLDADDVMQVTLLEAFLRIKSFRPTGPSAFTGWLRQIAENNLRDAIRGLEAAKRPQPDQRRGVPNTDESYAALYELATASGTPSRIVAKKEVRQAIERALTDLPPDYARVLQLYELEGRPGAEVAGVMGRSEGAVRILVARARDRLREVMGGHSRFFSDSA